MVDACDDTGGTYRSSAIVNLRSENDRLTQLVSELRSENASLRGEELLPFRPTEGPEGTNVACRMCGYVREYASRLWHGNGFEKRLGGPSCHFEPAYTPSWLARLFGRKPHPPRMRRQCGNCEGVYYEEPLSNEIRRMSQ